MKRIVYGGLFAALLILLQASPARVTPDKGPTGWQKVQDFQVLKLWETDLGPKSPQVVILQLSEERQKELEHDPLAFYEKYGILKPLKSDRAKGHLVLRLAEYKAGAKDPVIAVVVHDLDTYSGFASFEVEQIK